MRPYLAIIKDSFREAVSSFMLWALLAILTFILLMLAPFSYSEQLVGELPWGDVAEWRVMLLAIKEGSQTDGPSPSKHIYEQLDGSLTKRIDRLWEKLQDIEDDDDARGTGQEVASICSKLHENLNELLEAKDFYDEAAWDEIELTDEAKELVAQNPSDLSQVRLQRRNRLLLEAAYPALVRKSMGVEFRPTWMGRTIAQVPLLGAPAATTKEAVVEWYEGYIGFLMNWVVTLIIVFVGIIFTSAIIPRMFEPGSISLLLSKPVRRSYLFIAKFFGGCAFMLLSSAYIVAGIYLIAGVRIGIWNPKVFMCIPLFTFVFAVYYAVSAYIGAVWRSAIVSVLAAILFFFLCWSIGTVKTWVADPILDMARVVSVVDGGGATFAVNNADETFFWDEDAQEWKNTFQRPFMFGMDQSKKPLIYDEENGRLLSTTVSFNAASFSGGSVLAVGRDQDAWALKNGVALPPGTLDLFQDDQGELLAISPLGFFKLTGEALPEDEPPVAARRANFAPEEEGSQGQTGSADGDGTSGSEDDPDESESAEDDPDSTAAEDALDETTGETGTDTGVDTDDDANTQTSDGEPATDDGEPANDGESPGGEDETPDDETNQTADPADGDSSDTGESTGDDEPMDEAIDELPPSLLRSPFVQVGPDKPLDVAGPMSVAFNHEKKMIAVYTGGVVATYQRDADGYYNRKEKQELSGSEQKAATLGFAGSVLIVGRDDGHVIVLDADSLKELHDYTPEGQVPARFVKGSPNGKWFAILFQNRQLWLYDAVEKKISRASLWSQGDVSAVTFNSASSLLIADRVARVRELELPSLKVTKTLDPVRLPHEDPNRSFGFMTFYRWVLTPLYTILPRPGELGWTMNYVMTGEKTSTLDDEGPQPGVGVSADISSHQHSMRDPWAPVISCGIFVIVMLALGCWYIERREF